MSNTTKGMRKSLGGDSRPSATIDRFGGLDATPPRGGEMRATAIENFRVHQNGTISKRCGFSPLFRISDPIRAHIRTRIDGIPYLFLLAGNRVFSLSLTGKIFSPSGRISSATGGAHFFYHEGDLFLWATDTLYRVGINSLTSVLGYVPLIGRDWPNDEIGEPYEPVNFLHDQVRISYIMGDPPSIFLCSPYPIKSIHSVTVNGEVVPPERYEQDDHLNTVNLLSGKAGDRITVHLSVNFGYEQERSAFANAGCSIPFGKADGERLCCWSQHSVPFMFTSRRITEEQLSESRLLAPNSVSVYFPVGNQFQIGDGRYFIRGATRDRDRMLVFTEGNTWMVTESDSTTEIFPTSGVNADIGTPSPGGVTRAGKHTVSVGNAAMYRWSDAQSGAYFAERLSDKIAPFLSYSFYNRATVTYYEAEDELWFLDDYFGTVWILRPQTGDWYTFQGIPATELLDLGEYMGFISSDGIYYFNREARADQWKAEDPRPIRALYRADFGDMGSEKVKTLSHLVLRGTPSEAALSVEISEPFSDSFLTTVIRPREEGGYPEGRIRLPHRRLRQGALTLRAEDEGAPVIRRLGLYTQ